MTMRFIVALIFAAVLVCVSVAARQVQPYPGPGSGIVTVAGTVNVGNSPSVQAAQYGEWKMVVANIPDVRIADTAAVRIASPSFLTPKRTYEVVWGTGDRETISVLDVGVDGWARVQHAGGQRWVNASLARSITVLP
jgi:hypothetical protein